MPGIRDEGAVDSCLAQPRTTVFGVERFATLAEKAAAYCFFVVRNHPFFDGNKRTGFVAALHFLRQNRAQAEFSEDEVYDVVMAVAAGTAGIEELTAMFNRVMDGSSH
jgi:death-on-curing protein